MTDEDVAERPDDPYDLDLPAGWTADTEDGTTRYKRADGDLRVEITEFSRGLSLYWWVDVYERAEDGWRRVETGLGDSFTRAGDAAAAAQSFFDEARGEDGARSEPAGVEQF